MAVTYNKMLLDINEKPNDIITAVQNDTNSRYLDVLLYDNGIPINLTGCEVKIFMEKPEKGGEVWNDGVITDAESGRCEFLLTTESLAKVGHLQVQISIWKDNVEILSSQIFEIMVTKSLLGESSVETSNEYGTLVVLFQNLYEAHALMTTMVENIGVPAEVAERYDLDTMWQAWEFLVAYMKGDLTDKIDEAIANSSIQGVLNKLDTLETNMAEESTSQKILSKMGEAGFLANCNYIIHEAMVASQTPISITGKGKFYYALVNQEVTYNNNTGVVKVIVDGKTIINSSFTNTGSNSSSSNYHQEVHISNPSLAISAEDYTNNESLMHIFGGGAIPIGGISSELLCETSSFIKTNSLSASAFVYFHVFNCIEFKESFEITMTNCATKRNSKCYVCYSLDEE